MAPNTLPPPRSFHIGDDTSSKDQEVVQTKYGRGIIVGKRKIKKCGDADGKCSSHRGGSNIDDETEPSIVTCKEIELLDDDYDSKNNSTKIHNSTTTKSSFRRKKPRVFFSSANFPGVLAQINDNVVTRFGRGKVIEIRNGNYDNVAYNQNYRGTNTIPSYVIILSSWRLAGRSKVLCYLSSQECKVVRKHSLHEMTVFEKVEHANDLKVAATKKFGSKDYDGSLLLYSEAVDAVRYVQHGTNSNNELRADLIVVMVTCSLNASLCCSKKRDWKRCDQFARNALILIEAIEKRKDSSKILKVLHNDGISDSQLFGAWKGKSMMLSGKALMEQHETKKSVRMLKKVNEAIQAYIHGEAGKDGVSKNDKLYKQLSALEKDVLRIRSKCSQKTKLERKKEKRRAVAMFKGCSNCNDLNEKKNRSICSQNLDVKHESNSHDDLSRKNLLQKELFQIQKEKNGYLLSPENNDKDILECFDHSHSVNGHEDKDEDEGNNNKDNGKVQPSFFDEHCEAIMLVSAICLGFFFIRSVMNIKKK